MNKKYTLTFLLALFAVRSYSQENFFEIEPEFAIENGFNVAKKNWIFFNQAGEPRDTMLLSAFYFHDDGKKNYAIEYSLDIVRTKDSIVFSYDSLGRKISQVHHVEIVERDTSKPDFIYDGIDELKQWSTIYLTGKEIKISPSGDTTIVEFNEFGKIKSENKNIKKISYKYNEKGMLQSKVEIPYRTVYAKGSKSYAPTDTITTTYNEIGYPILTKGSKIRIDYKYLDGRLTSEKRITNRWGQESTYEKKYAYDENGKLINEEIISNEELVGLNKYEYDQNGLLRKSIDIDLKTDKISLIIEYIFE